MDRKISGGAAGKTKQLNYGQIEIMLDTNIPAGEGTEQITLTGATLGLSQKGLPFFSPFYDYDYGKSMFWEQATPADRAAIFFDRAKFESFLFRCKKYAPPAAEQEGIKEALAPNATAHRNAVLMIRILFQKSHNITETYMGPETNLLTHFIESARNPTKTISAMFSGRQYVTLHNGGKKYTLLRSIWLNDFYTHPIYRQIYIQHDEYVSWLQDNIKGIIEIVTDKYHEMILSNKYNGYYIRYKDDAGEPQKIENYIVEHICREFLDIENLTAAIMKLSPAREENYDALGGLDKDVIDSGIEVQTIEQRRNRDVVAVANINAATIQLFGKSLGELYNQTKIENSYDYSSGAADSRRGSPLYNLVKTKYDKLVEFIKFIHGFLHDNYDPIKNYDKFKTNIIGKLKKNIYNEKLKNFLVTQKMRICTQGEPDEKRELEIKACVSADEIERQQFYTGVQNVGGKYQIYLQIDVMQGEGRPDCKYLNEDLGNDLKMITNREEYRLFRNRFFYNLDTKEVQNVQKPIGHVEGAVEAVAKGGAAARRRSMRGGGRRASATRRRRMS